MTAQPVELMTVREKIDADERDRIIRALRQHGETQSAIYPFGASGPLAWREQGIYTLSWSETPGQPLVEFDFVHTDRYGETFAEALLMWCDPADLTAELRTRINLTSITSRDRLAAALDRRTAQLKMKWAPLLDLATRWTMRQYREGDPGLLLRDADELPAGTDVLTDPPLLEADGLAIIFGDGGSLKSLLSLAAGASLQRGESYIDGMTVTVPRRVGYVDWEWSDRRHRRRLLELTGPDMPDLAYIRCWRPITEERDRLRRWVRRYGIDYAIVDSVGLACGAEPESAEVATRFVNVLAELVPAALGVAHVTKAAADKAPDKPFGSVYWHNSARRTWYVRKAADGGGNSARIGLYNRKANDGPLAQPFGLAFDWDDGRLAIRKQDVREVPELDAGRSIRARMHDLLGRAGAMELHTIATELDEKIDSVKKAAERNEGSAFIRLPGPDGVYRWALKARE